MGSTSRVTRLLLAACLAATAAAVGLFQANADQQIVGGQRASIADYSFAVYLATADGFQFCGGTLVDDNKVVIRGERVGGPGDMPCEQFHRVERGHGRFSRSFALPEAIDVADVSADLKDGILTVRIPKARSRGARRVAVTA